MYSIFFKGFYINLYWVNFEKKKKKIDKLQVNDNVKLEKMGTKLEIKINKQIIFEKKV